MDVRGKFVELITEFYGCDPMYYGVDVNALADYLINNRATVQEWISVKDRLPEYSNDGFADAVLVTDGFVQHMAYFVGGEWRFAESGEIKEPMWYRITHWMPLPQPPKGE